MSKKTNDQIVLEQIVSEKCKESGGKISYAEYFEIYSAEQILKHHDLTYDDILSGIVASGGDGGIDSIYAFVNGELLNEDTKVNAAQKQNAIELYIIQSKTSPSFSEAAITKFRETAEDLFNLSNDVDSYSVRYNKELRERATLFRKAYGLLAKTFPKLRVRYFYVTQGTDVHPNVEDKVPKLERCIHDLFGGSEFFFQFVGASKLLEMTRDSPSTTRILEISESPISTAGGSYICLVELRKYFDFISDAGAMARSMFESNVRDYQGSVVVNTAIRKTLENKKSEDFWYLNNGVTIITPRAVSTGRKITIEDPQIVNGLQSSHEIYRHFSESTSEGNDGRSVLVRVICEEDAEARDRIIRATNSQTSIPPASLRSADEIHRNIEDYLKVNGYFYDRRKNFYKNRGEPISRIIGIPYLAQAYIAIVLQRPDHARARPSTLLNSDTEYRSIFSLDTPIDVYLKVIMILKAVEVFLKEKEVDRKTLTNIKFHTAMAVAVKLTKEKTEMVRRLHQISNVNVDSVLEDAFAKVHGLYESLGSSDQVAKGPQFANLVLS
jgi:hypothetical protein